MKIKAIVIALAVCILFQACTLTRAFTYWGPNITDHKIFDHDEILPSDNVFYFNEGNKEIFEKERRVSVYPKGTTDTIKMTYDEYFAQKTTTTAFLVIRNDSILYENYFRGYTRDSISKIFSVSKSITSLLTGIAVDEGYIKSVHDPVTKYVPELKKKNARFERLTIEHLLNMRSGFKFNEDSYFPTSKATNLYYGTNHLGKIKRVRFKHEPGEVHEYQSIVTALLGIIVERATGRNLSEYLQEKVWAPMGMENRATWDIDDRRHHSNKAHVGINTTAIDLAKIGRLYLNNGNWNGKQIVSADWVAQSITPNADNEGYQYQWYSYGSFIPNPEKNHVHPKFKLSCFTDSISARKYAEENYPNSKFIEVSSIRNEREYWGLSIYPNEQSQFAAIGIMQQIIFVDPKKNIIVIRLGEQGDTHVGFIRSLINRL